MFDSTSRAAIDRAGSLMNQARSALGLAKGPDPLAGYRIADSIRYALSGRQDAAKTGAAALFDDEFLRAGFTPTTKYSAFVPAAAIARHMQTRLPYIQPYQTTVAGAGAELVETTLTPSLFIDALRPRSVVLQLGARTVGGLQGDVQIPRQATASSAYWLTTSGSSPVVSGAITESEGTFDATPLTVAPAQVGGYGTMSRQFLLQTGSDLIEQIVANDVANVLATAIDVAAIQGSGTSGVPTGITNTSGVGTASGTTFAYATSVSAAQTVAAANAVLNQRALGWIAPPATAGLLAARQKVTGYPNYVWSGNVYSGNINGHTALSTANAPASTAIFGDWSQILVLQWGDDAPVELEFSQFGAGFAAGDVAFRAIMSCNIVVRHPPSFVVITGVT